MRWRTCSKSRERMKWRISIAGLLLTVCVIAPFFWLASLHRDFDDNREEQKIQRMVRSLSSIQEKNEKYISRMQQETLEVVKIQFPWLPKNNTLPNYFESGGAQYGKSQIYGDNEYKNGSVVFLHYPRASGTAVTDCLHSLAVENHMAMSPVMTSKNRLYWEESSDKSRIYRNRLKIHRGKYAFGICENLNVSCSYFVLLRDPMEQAVSSYTYCKEEVEDELCDGLNANKVSLREWILQHGSVLFKQLMFKAEFCTESLKFNSTVPEEEMFSTSEIPCWLKQKILMEKYSSVELAHAVNYIIQQLRKWFAVVGFASELKDSLKMFETVFGLPITKCQHFREKIKRSPVKESVNTNSANSVRQRQSDIYDENDPFFLLDDTYVKQALEPDYRIYKEARRLFHIQKQVLTNRINR